MVVTLHCTFEMGRAQSTYVDNISNGKVRRELTDPANKHLYIRSKIRKKEIEVLSQSALAKHFCLAHQKFLFLVQQVLT